jgi:RES domain-containing protein
VASAWRIVLEAWAADAFVGEGAKARGGRWNSRGSAVVYTSQYKSLAALETLVHLNPVLGVEFKAFSCEFSDALIEMTSATDLPKDWRRHKPVPSATQRLGDKWLAEARSAVLAVPSVVIPEELNYLLNPAHPDFAKISVKPPHVFVFDPRLL